jgi:hypothetical protein
LRILADEKRQQLAAEANGEVVVTGDATLLRHALLNLVHNAIRYTPSGGRVTVCCSRRDREAILEVSDTDADNYYICRANALEDNVVLYTKNSSFALFLHNGASR